MKIVVDNAIPYIDPQVLAPAVVVRIAGADITPDDVRDADALIVRTRTRCDERLLGGSGVRIVATATIGFDHIDTGWCRRNGVKVATAAGSNARGVLQWVAATLVRLSQVQGWQPAERTLGVVGVGHVGSLVSEYARSWGFRVICCDPPRQAAGHKGFVSMQRIAAEADIITFHVPLDDSTHHLADGRFLASMSGHCSIINSSRGQVVDGTALLASGVPYALDVWENEPRPDRTLLAHATVATPHIAGYSAQGKANATAMAVRAVAEELGLGVPAGGWYPAEVQPQSPRPIGWAELCDTIGSYFDIAAETDYLKSHPAEFEHLRDSYAYRKEYF